MLEQFRYSFLHISIEVWNGLDNEIVKAVSTSLKLNIIIVDMETGQHGCTSLHVHYNHIQLGKYTPMHAHRLCACA